MHCYTLVSILLYWTSCEQWENLLLMQCIHDDKVKAYAGLGFHGCGINMSTCFLLVSHSLVNNHIAPS